MRLRERAAALVRHPASAHGERSTFRAAGRDRRGPARPRHPLMAAAITSGLLVALTVSLLAVLARFH